MVPERPVKALPMMLQEAKALAAFGGWHLLPVCGGQLHPLLPLPQSPVICSGADWPKTLASTLQKLGCQCVSHLIQLAWFFYEPSMQWRAYCPCKAVLQ